MEEYREITGVLRIHIPQLHPFGKSHIVFLGAASALSCSPTKRFTEEETAIAGAVSGSLCMCVGNLRSLLIYGILYTEFVL